jgi:hypothetical protein
MVEMKKEQKTVTEKVRIIRGFMTFTPPNGKVRPRRGHEGSEWE